MTEGSRPRAAGEDEPALGGRRGGASARGRGRERGRRRGRGRAPGAPRGAAPPGGRPDGRTEPRLAAAVPARDRARAAADRRGGGRAGEADRARRHRGQAAHGRGEPAAGRVDREGLRGTRPDAAGPDPGGLARADQGGREVRLQARLQVLDLRDLVDPAGGHAVAGRQGPHDPHPGPHGRAAQQAAARRTPADPDARARTERGRARRASSSARSARCAR